MSSKNSTYVAGKLNILDLLRRIDRSIVKLDEIREVTDAGCGSGEALVEAARIYPHIHFTGIEPSIAYMETLRSYVRQNPSLKNLRTELATIQDSKLEKESQDLVFLVTVHSFGPRTGTSEEIIRSAYGFVKPRGRLVFAPAEAEIEAMGEMLGAREAYNIMIRDKDANASIVRK